MQWIRRKRWAVAALIYLITAAIPSLSQAAMFTLYSHSPITLGLFTTFVLPVLGPLSLLPAVWQYPVWRLALMGCAVGVGCDAAVLYAYLRGPDAPGLIARVVGTVSAVYLCVIPIGMWCILGVRRVDWSKSGRCRHCNYNLTGNVSGICPECGTPVLPGTAPPARPADGPEEGNAQ